ncbi:MAG: DUF3592 domain-containing protein [Clostridia bacterium]|nr:DUF3592 domain-containing protein [Clostridia bacterium]
MKYLFKNWGFWTALIAVLIGLGVFSYGIYRSVNGKSKLDNYIEISAYVIDYAEVTNDDETLYAEIVQYYVNGVSYTAKNTMSSSDPKRIGSVMKIAFNPENPEDCIFVSTEKWLKVFLYVFGGGMTAFGVVFMVCLVRLNRRKNL